MNHSKILSSLLTCSMILGMTTPALAAGNGTSDVTLKVETGEEPSVVQVKVPSEIPISQDKDGVVTVADNLAIQNLSTDKAVDITAIQVTGKNGWEIIDYSTDISGEAEGTKKLGLEFRGDGTTSSGAVSLSPDNWSVDKEQSLQLNVNAKLPKQGEDYETKQSIAQVDYTIEVHEGEVTPPPVEEGAIRNNWDSSTKMLPTGEKAVTFSWDSTNEDATITSVESSNPEVATIAKSPVSGFAEMPYNGTEDWVVTAVAKGTTTITATLSSGETTTFEVGVYELNGGSDGNIDITIPGDGYTEGDDLGDSDITIEIPVTGPDGEDTVIEVKPEIPDGTELQPGDNEIEVDVVVDGVTIHITIVIKVESSNPSDGLTQTIEEAQAMGFTFSSYEDGLQIDSFKNKQVKKEINVPEQIGDFKVLRIGNNVFKGQSNLTKITLPNTIKTIGDSAFSGCTGLTSLNLDQTKVEGIGSNAFLNCSSLKSLSLSPNITSIGQGAFNGTGVNDCSLTITQNIPKNIGKELNVSNFNQVILSNLVSGIPENAFYNYNNLKYISIPSSVTSIGNNAFNGCTSLSSITIPDSVTSIGTSAFQSCSNLESVDIPNGVTSIGDYTFKHCSSLTSAVLPSGINNISDGMFVGCTSLSSITIPDSVTSIGTSAFQSCSNLESVDIPNGVTSIGTSAFQSCSNLESVDIPNGVTSIGASAFGYCDKLTNVIIPDSVVSIGANAFQYCSSIKSLTLPASVESIGSTAFRNCGDINSTLDIYCNIPDQDHSGVATFMEANFITVVIHDGVTSIGASAFGYCDKLTNVTIPDSVTKIGRSAFYECTSLVTTVPDTVDAIGLYAFENVPHIYYNGSASGSPWGAKAIN